MKNLMKPSALFFFVILFSIPPIFSQEADEQRLDMVDLKMDLVDTKLELLNTRIRVLDDKPMMLEMKLKEIENNIGLLNFNPNDLNEKFYILDSLLVIQQTLLDEQSKYNKHLHKMAKNKPSNPEFGNINESFVVPSETYVMSMLPVKLFEGTMELSVERVLNKGNSIELSAMATYASKNGIASYYMSNQKLEYFSAASSVYIPYSSESITGLGGSFAWRNYLLARTNPSYTSPGGPYVAPMVMYRRLTLSGFDRVYDEVEDAFEMVEVTQHLNVFSGGFLAGWQFVLWKVVTADVYLGGVVRLSKYDGTTGFTKYKRLQNIDFSGVMPTVGVKIGIVK
jgi:hypothetical protein